MKSNFWRHRALVLALLLLGAGLRLWARAELPPGLYHDEAQNGLDALNVLAGHFPLYFAANNGREPLFIYFIAASVGLFGRSPWALRLPSFFVGFLTLAATYDLARVLWGRRTGRWALAVLAVTFWHVQLSRLGFRAVLLPLCTALFLAQGARAVKTGSRRYWVAAGALYGVAWYTYMAVRFTPVALVVLALYARLRQTSGGKPPVPFRQLAFALGAALLVLLPLGLYTALHPDIVFARTGQVTVFSPAINGGDLGRTLLRHTLRTAGMFFVQGDRIWRHNLAWRPVWEPALGLAFVLGTLVALRRCRRDAGAALALLWTAVMALPTLLAEDAPHFLRGVGVLPTAALLPALGLVWLEARINESTSQLHASCFTSHVSRFTSHVSRLTPVLLLLCGAISTGYDYFVRYARAPLAYHWLEGGPTALAGRVNALLGTGWDGKRMQHGPPGGRAVYLDRVLWESWTTVPFLVPEAQVRFFPPAGTPALGAGVAFVVWPYQGAPEQASALLPHPAYLSVEEGPSAQGDKDPQPFTVALILQADPRPAVPEPIARFASGLLLRAALVRPEGTGVRVRLWWDVETALPDGYTVFVHYLRAGEKLAQHDGTPGRGFLPTTAWQSGDLILDEHDLPGVTADPAHDTLRIGLYRSDTGAPLPVVDAAGNPMGTFVDLGVILSP